MNQKKLDEFIYQHELTMKIFYSIKKSLTEMNLTELADKEEDIALLSFISKLSHDAISALVTIEIIKTENDKNINIVNMCLFKLITENIMLVNTLLNNLVDDNPNYKTVKVVVSILEKLLTNNRTNSLQEEHEQLKNVVTLIEDNDNLKTLYNFILLFSIDTNCKENNIELINLCNSLMQSKYLENYNLILVSCLLFKYGSTHHDLQFLKDSFSILSFTYILNPALFSHNNNLLLKVGKKYLNCFCFKEQTPRSKIVAEFICQRLLYILCNDKDNINKKNYISFADDYCTLLFNSEREQLRDILGQSVIEFATDLKQIVNDDFTDDFIEGNLYKFELQQDVKYIYRAIHIVLCSSSSCSDLDETTTFSDKYLLERVYHLNSIVQLIDRFNANIDMTFKFIAICTCLQYLHLILNNLDSLKITHGNNLLLSNFDEYNYFNIDEYQLMVEQFINLYSNFAFFPDEDYHFKSSFYSLFIKTVELNYQKILNCCEGKLEDTDEVIDLIDRNLEKLSVWKKKSL
ncbi:hypothetical protein ABK040_004240 [Willaertia magna]